MSLKQIIKSRQRTRLNGPLCELSMLVLKLTRDSGDSFGGKEKVEAN